MSDKKLVIIPTYNEKENIQEIIKAVLKLEGNFHVLVVDDSSPDGTGSLVRELLSSHPDRLFLETRTEKNGLGRAYIHGFYWALNNKYDYIFEMDADFSHNPKDLIHLYEACKYEGADMAIGSRYSQGVNVVNWPMNRVLLSFFASKYVKLITGLPIHDATAGFICFTRKVLETIPLEKVKLVGYGFQIEMKFRAYIKKFTIKEIPIIFTDRTKGESKMSGAIISEAVFGVIKMKVMAIIGRL